MPRTEADIAPADGEERRTQRAGKRAAGVGLGERLIAGVPARIMRPRLVFLACLGAILAFGLLMVYSASSVEALSEYGSSTFFLIRQGAMIGIGLFAMAIISYVPLSFMRSRAMWWVWGAMLVLLVAVLAFGVNVGGATRWVELAGQRLQPSEFAKPVIIVTAAKIFHEYYEERVLDTPTFLILLGLCVGVPLLAIIAEPDLGSCLIIGGTVFAMCYFAGFSYRLILPLIAIALVVVVVLIFGSDYRSARLLADPWSDPYGDGYQATLAIMAFASGGLFGRGIGNSTMKYNYLPEAHNDYILAIIGEEVGFVGTIIFFAVYLAMIYAVFKIAERAPSVQGRLIAYGAAVLFALQFFINALGILGVTPMTGKTMPFVSYGGSSMIASLMVAGLVMRVSRESNVATEADERRGSLRVYDESTAGEARPRSARRAGFSVVDGGPGSMRPRAGDAAYEAAEPSRRPAPRGDDGFAGGPRYERRGSAPLSGGIRSAGGYERVDLGSDPASRLRGADGRGYDARRDARADERSDFFGPRGRADANGYGYDGGSGYGAPGRDGRGASARRGRRSTGRGYDGR